ncbi:MAG: HD domain-containing protein, partial [Clostridiales bacterium]|nr:HD domain-containing protein [Clostridiales bacterium]
KQDLTGVESEEAEQHAVVGYRILNLFDDTLDLAEYIYSHHENWDGSGYPRGLMGEQIPLIARIISVVEVYDRALGRGMSNKEALEYIECGAGKRFDPWIVELFIEMMGN